jgi:hypothetical protein
MLSLIEKAGAQHSLSPVDAYGVAVMGIALGLRVPRRCSILLSLRDPMKLC